MYCYKCGKQIDDGSRFCNYCGTQLITDEQTGQTNSGTKKKMSLSKEGNDSFSSVLRVVAIIFIIFLAFRGLNLIIEMIFGLFSSVFLAIFSFEFIDAFISLVYLIFNFVKFVIMMLIVASLYAMTSKLTKKTLPSFIIVGVGGFVLGSLFSIIQLLFNLLVDFDREELLIFDIAAFAVCAIVIFVLAYFYDPSIINQLSYRLNHTSELTETLSNDFSDVIGKAQDVSSKVRTKVEEATASKPLSNTSYNSDSNNVNGSAYTNSSNSNSVGLGSMYINSNRSVVKVIVFTIVTCGIYPLFFYHGLSRDVNIICEGDGKHTRGIFEYIVFSILTCGIYPYIWIFGVANRMCNYAADHGVRIREDGTTIILWYLFGILVCGIGPFVALYYICNNINIISDIYDNNLKIKKAFEE